MYQIISIVSWLGYGSTHIFFHSAANGKVIPCCLACSAHGSTHTRKTAWVYPVVSRELGWFGRGNYSSKDTVLKAQETVQMQWIFAAKASSYLASTQDQRWTALFSEVVHLCKYQHSMTLVQRQRTWNQRMKTDEQGSWCVTACFDATQSTKRAF